MKEEKKNKKKTGVSLLPLRRLGLTLNSDGVCRVLKSGEEAIRSSRVCRKTLWKSSISGRLPNRLSIWVGKRVGKSDKATHTHGA